MKREKNSYIITYEEDSGRAKVNICAYTEEDAIKLCYKLVDPIFIYNVEQR